MSNFGDHPAGFFGDSSFYNGVAKQSLRFDAGSSPYLTRTPSSAGNKKTWTWSTWIKRTDLQSGSPYGGFGILFAGGDEQNMWAIPANCTLIAYWINSEQLAVVGSGNTVLRLTSAKQRDLSAWYNFVVTMDTTQGTANDRTKVYINGVQQTSFATTNNVDQNTDLNINEAANHLIGGQQTSNAAAYMNMYLAETNFVDGTALDASYFGEFKNGVWIPIDTSGLTFGTNGFRLKFDQVGVGTASTSTIGADTSGNTHHFTSSGIVADDCSILDSPENNFCTLNPLIPIPNGTISEGNLEYVRGSEANHGSVGASFTIPTTGKWYWEVRSGKSANNEAIGVANISDHNPQLPAQGSEVGSRAGDYIYRSNAQKVSGGSSSSYGATFSASDVIGVAWSSDDGTITFYKNNASQGIAYSSITQVEGKFVPAISQAETSSETPFNFGQESSFTAHKTAQGNTDGNGIGDFYYAPPSGYLALCTSNLPEPTISPNDDTQADDHFNCILYTGNGSAATHTVGFRPNLVWGKKRASGAQNHWLINDVGDIDNFMSSDEANAESTTAGTTFNATSFTTASNDLYYNNNSTYVVWAWKGNGTGTAVSNSNGSITSTVSANTDAGFSIITYSGNSTKGATIGHGLSAAPEMVWFKRRNASAGWAVYNKDLTDNGYALLLNSNATEDNRNTQFLNETSPTSTLITLGDWNEANAGSNYVAYAFHSVEGYSKIGNYIGNVNADGAFVFTGFRPALVIVKRINGGSSYDWFIHDNKRSTFNVNDERLAPNSNDAESTSITSMDFLSNGFKIRTANTSYNEGTVIYMAFAEAPFKYSNAR